MVRFNKASLLCIGILFLAACSPAAKPAADSTITATAAAGTTAATDDSQGVRDVNAAWFKAYNAHDATALSVLYADDAVLYMPGMPMARGREAIKAAYQKDLDAMAKAGYMNNMGTTSEAATSGDLGYEANTFTVTDKTGKKIDTGKYVTVFMRKDGKWQITRDIWNSDMPAPAAG